MTARARHRSPSYRIVDGFRLPRDFPVDGFRSALDYEPGRGDVFVSTYPKCGTTWVQHIVYLLFHDGESLPVDRSLGTVFPHLEEVGADTVTALPRPRLIKTHLPLDLVPYAPHAKFIYVARNPFDCATSFFHHTRGFVTHYDFADGTFDDFFECFVAGEVDFGDYFDNLLGWHGIRGEPNVHFLTYEQLKDDTVGRIRSIAAFLEVDLVELAGEAALLERVVAGSSFSQMSRDQQRWSSQRPASMPQFVRKGVVGDWTNHFSQGQLRRLLARAELKGAGALLRALWPGVMAEVEARR